MKQVFNTQLKGKIVLSDSIETVCKEIEDISSLYKFIWVQSGWLVVEIDYADVRLEAGEIVALTPYERIKPKSGEGEHRVLLFNADFYCIYAHDDEVSCNGFLFHGGKSVMLLQLPPNREQELRRIADNMEHEYTCNEFHKEEMLRILLKQFIIIATRIAREHFKVSHEKERAFNLVREFNVLVDAHFREKKLVSQYAEMLNRSPKTLANVFGSCSLPSPLKIIHDRIEAEARRLLINTDKTAKEIAQILGFEDLPAFSRFFKAQTGRSISDFRRQD